MSRSAWLVLAFGVACSDSEEPRDSEDAALDQTVDGQAETGLDADGGDVGEDPLGDPSVDADDAGDIDMPQEETGPDAVGEDAADAVEDGADAVEDGSDATVDAAPDVTPDVVDATPDAAGDVADTGSSGEELVAIPGFWGVGGQINALLVHEGVVYAAGEFEYAGPPTGPLAAFHVGKSGAEPSEAPSVRGYDITAAIEDGAGGFYIAGRLTEIDGVAVGEIAHILPTGAVDPSFQVNVTSPFFELHGLALSEDALYVGGQFFQVNGSSRSNLMAVNPETGALLDWAPQALGRVTDVAIDGDVVYVAGDFTSIDEISRPLGLAAIDAETGDVTDWAPTADGAPTDLLSVTVAGDVVVLWGYEFGGGAMVAIDSTGTEVTGFAPEPDGMIRAVIATDDALWVGGDFEEIGGEPRQRIAAISRDTGAALSFAPDWGTFEYDDEPLEVFQLALSGTTLYAYVMLGQGTFNRAMLVAFDTTTGTRTPFEVSTSGGVTTAELVAIGSDVYLASDFRSAGGVVRSCLAAFDATSGAVLPWSTAIDDGTGGCAVYTMVNDGDNFYFGGYFTEVGGEERAFLAAVDDTGAVLPWNPDSSAEVYTLLANEGVIYASGDFGSVGGESRRFAAAIETDSGAITSWDPAPDTYVDSFTRAGDVVYASGSFEEIGGQDRIGLAGLDATTGLATAWEPALDGDVRALFAHGGLIHAAGSFTAIGGASRSSLAALDATGLATDWDPEIDGSARALVVTADFAVVIGTFDSVGGSPPTAVGLVDLDTGLATGWAPPAVYIQSDGSVYATAVAGGRLYAGGHFEFMGDTRTVGLAAFELP